MKALTGSASKIILDKSRDRGFLSSKELYVNRPKTLFLPSKKHVTAGFLQVISAQHKAVEPVSAVSSDTQAELETLPESQTTYQSKTVHVKFQLEKECQFGEQFFLVGDDPMFGFWDPESAIPMDWSDGNVWSVEVDVPVGKSIQFKFILKESTGNVVWQPGSDRIFRTWETDKKITVIEDWENVEDQKIIEEEPMANQNDEPMVNSEMLVADCFTQPKEELVSNIHKKSAADDSGMSFAKIPEKPITIVAENIGNPKKDSVLKASNEMLGEMQISQQEETSVANKDMTVEENILGNSGRVATVKNQESTDVKGNLITHEEDVVLVPGLTPSPMALTESETQDEIHNSNVIGAPLGTNETENHSLPELDKKQEPESDPLEGKKGIVNGEEQQLDNELKQMPHLGKEEQVPLAREQEPDSKPLESGVLHDDIQWGRRTLQMLLNNLGLL